eukprot:268031-Chlamydomonas_euryale.AAC.1
MDTDLYEELLSKIPPEHLEHYKKKVWGREGHGGSAIEERKPHHPDHYREGMCGVAGAAAPGPLQAEGVSLGRLGQERLDSRKRIQQLQCKGLQGPGQGHPLP